jgi:hypothetical protein
MATGPGRTRGPGRVRHAAVRRADRNGRGARPRLIGGLVDCRSHRRREPGTGLWHHRPMRCGHIPRERENYPYQHGADCRGESRPTAGAEEPSRSRLSTHDTFPSHGNAAYQRAEQRGLASSEGYYYCQPFECADAASRRRFCLRRLHLVALVQADARFQKGNPNLNGRPCQSQLGAN